MLAAITTSVSLHAKLIDKTLVVLDKELFTLSDAKQILNNINARKNISPQLYNKNDYQIKDIADDFIRTQIIRKNLDQLGFVISDAQVESQIKQTEANLHVNREELLQFLKTNNISFDEYFQLTKETIEFNIFLARIIKPLIKITDFELKNEFTKNGTNSSNTYSFTLVDFSIKKNLIDEAKLAQIRQDLIKFQKDGLLPQHLKNLETNVLNDVKEDGLSLDIKSSLVGKSVEEFSTPVAIGDNLHLFFIKKKSIVESEQYTNSKMQIEQKIFLEKSENVINKWLDQEKTKFYIKTYL